jgi:hypothetical protein
MMQPLMQPWGEEKGVLALVPMVFEIQMHAFEQWWC